MSGFQRRLKDVSRRAEYYALRVLSKACRVLPLSLLRRLGAGVGWFAYRVVGFRKDVASQNIGSALNLDNTRAIERIGTRCYMHLGRSVVECAAFLSMSRQELLDMVTLEGLEHLDEAREYGRGAILYSGHFGNWELLGAVIARRGYPIHATDTEHRNPYVHRLISEARMSQGIKMLPPNTSAKSIIRLLSENKFVTYAADQDAGPGGLFVDFLGRPASTLKGPAFFAVRFGCPIAATFLIRQGRDHHRAVFEKLLWPQKKLPDEEATVELTQRFTSLLERYVRAYPDQYLWGHRRWKTKPPETRPTAASVSS